MNPSYAICPMFCTIHMMLIMLEVCFKCEISNLDVSLCKYSFNFFLNSLGLTKVDTCCLWRMISAWELILPFSHSFSGVFGGGLSSREFWVATVLRVAMSFNLLCSVRNCVVIFCAFFLLRITVVKVFSYL